jgi:uncharacterized protein (UPF0147 family)
MMANIAGKKVENIISVLAEIQGDTTVPKNVKDKLSECVNALQEDCEMSIRMNKAMQALDDISADVNLQAYTRTQLWNIASMMETM